MDKVYQLNVFGVVYPEHGKQTYKSLRPIYNRLEKYRQRIMAKYQKVTPDKEMHKLQDSIAYGYQIVEICTLDRKNWQDLFTESKFKVNKKQRRIRDYENGD